VFSSYGRLVSNFDFFFSYGFIQQPNPMDEVHMQLKLNPTDPLYQSKIDELKDSWRTQMKFKAVANL